MTWRLQARRWHPPPRRAVLLGLAIAVCLGGVSAYASGFNLSASPNRIAAFDNNSVSLPPTIPAGTRATAAWNFTDHSGSTATPPSPCTTYPDYCAGFYNDSNIDTTSKWPASTPAFGTNYLSFAMNTPLPTGTGINVSSVSFNFAYQQSSSSDAEACYFIVTKTAGGVTTTVNGNVTAPLSSSSGWLGCNTSSPGPAGWSSSAGLVSTSPVVTTANGYDQVPLSALSSTGDVNGLTVFVYEEMFKLTGGHASSDKQSSQVDVGTVSGTMVAGASSTPFTLYPISYTDSAGGTAVTTPWQLAAGNDNSFYPTTSTWSTGLFSTTRYLQFTFPSYVPATATATSVILHLRYSGDGPSEAACFIMDVTDGLGVTTPVGTSSAPAGCVSYSGSQLFATRDVDLHAVLTDPAKLNGAIFKLYWGTCNFSAFNGTTCASLTAHRTEHDLVTLDVNYNIP